MARAEEPGDSLALRHRFGRRAVEVAGEDAPVLANAALVLARFGEDIEPMMALVDRSLALAASSWVCGEIATTYATTGIPVSVAPAQRRAMTPSSTSTMTGVLSSVILIRGSSESREARARNIPGTHVSITCQSDLPVPAMFDCELPFEGLADAAKTKDFCGV